MGGAGGLDKIPNKMCLPMLFCLILLGLFKIQNMFQIRKKIHRKKEKSMKKKLTRKAATFSCDVTFIGTQGSTQICGRSLRSLNCPLSRALSNICLFWSISISEATPSSNDTYILSSCIYILLLLKVIANIYVILALIFKYVLLTFN